MNKNNDHHAPENPAATHLENIPEPVAEELPEENTELLNELQELVEKYNETAQELLHQHLEEADIEHFNHLIHEIRGELIHLEELNHRANENESEKRAEFFNHHNEVMTHMNAHWFHAQQHFVHIMEESLEEEMEELEALHHRIQHLLAEMKREKEEEKHTQHSTLDEKK